MNKIAKAFVAVMIVLGGALPVYAQKLPGLRVSGNHRFLIKEDGSPFFYLADTAWALVARLKREDVDLYLRDRASKGFTVIQAVALPWGALAGGNAYGDKAFLDEGVSRPNGAYFRHVDYVVDKAESLGMYVGLLPLWGSAYLRPGSRLLDKSSAFSYGKFLGSRYRDKAIIWILGGDIVGKGIEEIERSLAEGLSAGDGGSHLKTYHPLGPAYSKGPDFEWRGTTSSMWFHNDAWLDFNMMQSGHSIRNRNYDLIAADYALAPPKPIIDGESGYENITDSLRRAGSGARKVAAHDVRRYAYIAVFAGAAGHTYGCNEIYPFWSPGQPKAPWGDDLPWQEALKLPGASQVRYVRSLMESRPYLIRIPDQTLIDGDALATTDRIQATRASDGSYAFVYTSSGKAVTVRMDKLSGSKVQAYWFDPRKGTTTRAGAWPAKGTRQFTPPSHGEGNDWVLVLDDMARRFPPPGTRRR